jgi:hypothetical protein
MYARSHQRSQNHSVHGSNEGGMGENRRFVGERKLRNGYLAAHTLLKHPGGVPLNRDDRLSQAV